MRWRAPGSSACRPTACRRRRRTAPGSRWWRCRRHRRRAGPIWSGRQRRAAAPAPAAPGCVVEWASGLLNGEQLAVLQAWGVPLRARMRICPDSERYRLGLARLPHNDSMKPPPFLGVLMLQTRFPRVLGDIGNPATFAMPVRHRIVAGASPQRVVRDGDPALLQPFVDAAKELVHEGARAIT